MPTKAKILEVTISVLIEGLLVYLVLVPFGGGENPWLFIKPLGIMFLPTLILFAVFMYGFKWDNFIPYFIISLLITVLGIFLHLPVILSFIAAMLLFWRLYDALTGNTVGKLWMVYLTTVIVAFFYLVILGIFNLNFPHHSWFLLLFFIQTVLTVVLHFIQAAKSGHFGKKMSVSYGLTFGGMIAAALILAWMGPFISKCIRFIIEGIGLVVFYIVGALWTWIIALRKGKLPQSVKNGNSHENKQTHQWAEMSNYHPPTSYFWAGLIIVFIIAIIIFFILRKHWGKNHFRKGRSVLNEKAYSGSFRQAIDAGRRKIKAKAPKDPVRLEIFQLHKKLVNQKEGRIGHETFGEWLERLPSKEKEASVIRNIYEKARYGKKPIKEHELREYKQAVDAIKKSIQKP